MSLNKEFGNPGYMRLEKALARAIGERRSKLTEIEVRQVLKLFDIPSNTHLLVNSEADAVAAAGQIGYPVALKVVSPKIVHKSDIGGVRLGLSSEHEVREAYRGIVAIVTPEDTSTLHGISVQAMVKGVAEVIIGIKRDETFGPVVMVGLGGIWVELMRDVELSVSPVSRVEAHAMLERLKGVPLLRGFRGTKPADEDAIVEIIQQVVVMAERLPWLREMDLNPIIVREKGKGAIVVDARAEIDWDAYIESINSSARST